MTMRQLKRKYDAYKVICLKPGKGANMTIGEFSAQIQDEPWHKIGAKHLH